MVRRARPVDDTARLPRRGPSSLRLRRGGRDSRTMLHCTNRCGRAGAAVTWFAARDRLTALHDFGGAPSGLRFRRGGRDSRTMLHCSEAVTVGEANPWAAPGQADCRGVRCRSPLRRVSGLQWAALRGRRPTRAKAVGALSQRWRVICRDGATTPSGAVSPDRPGAHPEGSSGGALPPAQGVQAFSGGTEPASTAEAAPSRARIVRRRGGSSSSTACWWSCRWGCSRSPVPPCGGCCTRGAVRTRWQRLVFGVEQLAHLGRSHCCYRLATNRMSSGTRSTRWLGSTTPSTR